MHRIFDSIFVLTKRTRCSSPTDHVGPPEDGVGFGQLGKANAMAVLTVIGIFVVLIPFLFTTYRQQTEER